MQPVLDLNAFPFHGLSSASKSGSGDGQALKTRLLVERGGVSSNYQTRK